MSSAASSRSFCRSVEACVLLPRFSIEQDRRWLPTPSCFSTACDASSSIHPPSSGGGAVSVARLSNEQKAIAELMRLAPGQPWTEFVFDARLQSVIAALPDLAADRSDLAADRTNLTHRQSAPRSISRVSGRRAAVLLPAIRPTVRDTHVSDGGHLESQQPPRDRVESGRTAFRRAGSPDHTWHADIAHCPARLRFGRHGVRSICRYLSPGRLSTRTGRRQESQERLRADGHRANRRMVR